MGQSVSWVGWIHSPRLATLLVVVPRLIHRWLCSLKSAVKMKVSRSTVVMRGKFQDSVVIKWLLQWNETRKLTRLWCILVQEALIRSLHERIFSLERQLSEKQEIIRNLLEHSFEKPLRPTATSSKVRAPMRSTATPQPEPNKEAPKKSKNS